MDIRETITQLYRDYESRNVEAVLNALPDDFRFEWPFDRNRARYAGTCNNKAELLQKLSDLEANFEFTKYQVKGKILVDGDRAAARLELGLTSKKTGHSFEATIAHFWLFKAGIPVCLVEYMDTALMTSESFSKSDTSSPAIANA
jgi:ketosteroid isomerase-like protein